MTEPVDATHFRNVLSRFPSGLVVLATHHEGRQFGVTCQAFASVSLDPPLVSAFLGNQSGSLWAITQESRFTVSVLADDQEPLARRFATSGIDKFDGVATDTAPGGFAVLAGALAWLECEVYDTQPAGDHTLVLGRVIAMSNELDTTPLLYWRGRYSALARNPFAENHLATGVGTDETLG